jgi:hypothetical protein
MKVDISPNLPPSSSWTTEAPTGSGSEGGGISAISRSRRMIMGISWMRGGLGESFLYPQKEEDKPPAPIPFVLSLTRGSSPPGAVG